MKLHVDADELAACVSCGLCLPHCPTYRVTGEEALSPRGRIAAMRAIDTGLEVSDGFLRSIDTCVQCRGCETACPSSVPFGRLMEGTRETIATSTRRPPLGLRLGLGIVRRPRALRALTTTGALAQRARLLPRGIARRLGLPARLPIRQPSLRSTGDDVWLFTGCVMDAWQRDVHQAAIDVLGAMGAGVALPGDGAACCGALHTHAGLESSARDLATLVIGAFPGDAPILVDSAGCGAALKDYGRLVGTDAAARFADRVRDVHEWIAAHADRLPPARAPLGIVAVHDPCHLSHAQHVDGAVRVALAPYADLVELDDDGLCCGAGGAYAVLQPGLAADIRDRKVAAIERTGAPLVASANPGCAIHLSGAGLDVRHPVALIAQAIAAR